MRIVKRIAIVAGIGLVFGFGWWFLAQMKSVRIVPATASQIKGAVPLDFVYHAPTTADKDNPWRRLDRLFSLSLTPTSPNFVPPLSSRSLPTVKQYLDASEFVEPSIDKILEDAAKLPPQFYTPNEASTLPGVNGAWTYCSLRLAYEQHEGNAARIWKALRRLLLLSRMSIRVEGPGPIFVVAHVWGWPGNLQVGLADPSLNVAQLEECLRLLPTEADVLTSTRHCLQLEYEQNILARLQPERVESFEAVFSKAEDVRRFYCGELDVLKSVRDTSSLLELKIKLLDRPYGETLSKVKAAVRKKLGVYPEYPWPDKKDNFLRVWWRDQVYRFGMRSTPNSMLRFLDDSSFSTAGLDRLAYFRALVLLARLHVALRIYEKRTGAFPAKLNQLVKSRILISLPKDPFTGGDFGYDGKAMKSIGMDRRWGTPNPAKFANDDVEWPLFVRPRL